MDRSRSDARKAYLNEHLGLIFAGTAVFMALVSGGADLARNLDEARDVSGLTVEKARVLQIKDSTGSGWSWGCGKGSVEQDFYVESSNAPAGQSPSFWLRSKCGTAVNVGDQVRVVRQVEDGVVVRTWLDPSVSDRDALADAGPTALGWVMITAILYLLWLLVRRWWIRRNRTVNQPI